MRFFSAIFYLLTLPLLHTGKVTANVHSTSSHLHQVSFKHIEVLQVGEYKTYIIPFKRIENLIVIEGKVDQIEGNFIFDTGAPELVLNLTYFRNYKNLGNTESGGLGGTTSSFKTSVNTFTFLQLNYQKLEATVGDLSTIENSKNIQVIGLLGTKLFEQYAVAIDLFKNQIIIHEVDRKGNIPEEQKRFRNLYLKTTFEFINQVILLDIAIVGKNFRMAFDTGAEVNLLDYRLPKKVLSVIYPINRITVKGVGKEKNEVLYGRIDTMQVGTRTFMNNRFLITNMSNMNKYYDMNIRGMLGYDFFARGIVLLNFVKREFEMYTLEETEVQK